MKICQPYNWEIVRLREVLYYEQPTDYIVSSTDYKDTYHTPVLTAGKSFILGYTNEKNGIYANLPCIIFDDFTTESKYVEFPFKVKSSAMKILTNNSNSNLKFLFFVMQTLECVNDIHKRFWISDFSNKFVYLPPLAEQQRIVNKVEELFTQIDIIEQNQTELEKLYDDLKKRTLDLAIQGKLVPQDENDEPASELLKRIRAEKKAKLGKKYVDSYIYKGDDNCYYEHIDGIANDKVMEAPFDIPENWTWCRIETIFDLQAGKFISAEKISLIKDNLRPFPCYGGNGLRGYVDCYNHEGAYPLIGRQGALCGNINTVGGKFYATEHAVVVTYHCEMVIGVISAFLHAMNLNQYSTATAQPGLAVSKINKILFPLPPVAEQQRIENKINEIFAKL